MLRRILSSLLSILWLGICGGIDRSAIIILFGEELKVGLLHGCTCVAQTSPCGNIFSVLEREGLEEIVWHKRYLFTLAFPFPLFCLLLEFLALIFLRVSLGVKVAFSLSNGID